MGKGRAYGRSGSGEELVRRTGWGCCSCGRSGGLVDLIGFPEGDVAGFAGDDGMACVGSGGAGASVLVSVGAGRRNPSVSATRRERTG